METSKKWKKEMKGEMGSLLEHKTWELVKLKKGRISLQNKWVYMIKMGVKERRKDTKKGC